MNEGPLQDALFRIEGPDNDGCVWICSPEGSLDIWRQNLGPKSRAVEIMLHWLSSIDHDESNPAATSQPEISLSEIKKRLAKRARKAARPDDHREPGGEG